MQPFLEIIAHELIKLYWYGTDVTLPSSLGGERVTVRAMMLQWICDYRGYPKCFRYKQSPAHIGACYCCGVTGSVGPSASVHVNGKPRRKIKTAIYGGAWRQVENATTEDKRRRYHGCQLNGSTDPASAPPFPSKSSEYFVQNAQRGDEALRNGISFKHSSHPSKETGTHLF